MDFVATRDDAALATEHQLFGPDSTEQRRHESEPAEGGPGLAPGDRQPLPHEAAVAGGEVMAHWADPENQKSAANGDKKRGDKDKHDKAGAGHKPEPGYPKVVDVSGEKVRVHSAAEEKEAEQIVTVIKEEYGVEVSSKAGVDAIKADYTQVPQAVTDKLRTKRWEMKELRALKRALAHFAPILGKNRQTSSRSGEAQEITSVSKVDRAIDEDSPSGQLDRSTLGEYFEGSKNFSMFTAGTNSHVDFKKSSKQLEGTAVHEIAHGLLKHELPAFIQATGYWTDEYTPSGAAGAEKPPTPYGETNASEDLSESAMFYFVEPKRLQKSCPKRYQFLAGVVASWRPVGDFPQVTPGPGMAYA